MLLLISQLFPPDALLENNLFAGKLQVFCNEIREIAPCETWLCEFH